MNTATTPFAMRCTQEQFESIRDELVRRGVNVDGVMIRNWDKFPYLTNNYAGHKLEFGNTSRCEGRTVYETFDKDILYKCCGWVEKELLGYKRNPEFDITAEQLPWIIGGTSLEKDGLYFWESTYESEPFLRACKLGIVGEGKWLIPVYAPKEKTWEQISKDNLEIVMRTPELNDPSSLLNPYNWISNAPRTETAYSLRHLTYEQQKNL